MTIRAKIYVEFFIRTDFNKGHIYIIKRPNEYVNEQDAGAKQGTLTPLTCRRQLEIILFYHRFLESSFFHLMPTENVKCPSHFQWRKICANLMTTIH